MLTRLGSRGVHVEYVSLLCASNPSNLGGGYKGNKNLTMKLRLRGGGDKKFGGYVRRRSEVTSYLPLEVGWCHTNSYIPLHSFSK